MPQNPSAWYNDWFSSPYYHILYKDRDEFEAAHFMDNLTGFLELEPGSHLLDLGCGRGRHARYLNKIGFKVTAADISLANIEFAKNFENEQLHFELHDMRQQYPDRFEAVLNLFTSFGYFEDSDDDIRTVKSMVSSLSETGYGVIDFLNAEVAIQQLVPREEKVVDGIHFMISRRFENKTIIKDIYFSDDGRQWHFTEKVKAFRKKDFEEYLFQAGARISNCFGNYDLDPFIPGESKRLILIFER